MTFIGGTSKRGKMDQTPKIYTSLSKEKLIKKLLEKDKRIEELERELKKYKNANTPSSTLKYTKASTQGFRSKKGARHGAPKGHHANTQVLGNPIKIISVFAKECGHCHSKRIELTKYTKLRKIITINANVIGYLLYEARCLDCSRLTIPSYPDLPESGIYDKKILAIVCYLKIKGRMPFQVISEFMKHIMNIPMSGTTAYNIVKKISSKLKPEYEKIHLQIQQADVVGGDETSLSVQGINHWVWVFCTKLLTFFKIIKDRGGTIVEDVLGKTFQGSLVSDGWKTYGVYCRDYKVRHGRCWAHGKREIKFECKADYHDIYKWYGDIYKLVKKAKSYKKLETRKKYYEKCRLELKRWVASAKAYTKLRKLAQKIENGGDAWFTCILYPEIPMDNNESERSIRPFVIQEKIMGCLRSDEGMEVYEIMMSLFSTWQKQQKNPYYILQTLL